MPIIRLLGRILRKPDVRVRETATGLTTKVKPEPAVPEREGLAQHLADFLETECTKEQRRLIDPSKADRFGRFVTPDRDSPIAKMSSDDCNDLFRAAMRARDSSNYGPLLSAEIVNAKRTNGAPPRYDTPDLKAAMTFEKVLLDLVTLGFDADSATLPDALRFMTETPFSIYQRAIQWKSGKLGLIRRLAVLFPEPDHLPETVRAQSERLVARVVDETGLSQRELIEQALVHPTTRALVKFTGLREETLLARHLASPPPRLGCADPTGKYAASLADLQRYQDAVKALIAEWQETGGAPAWMNSEEAYRSQFGDWPKSSSDGIEDHAFGWWHREKVAAGNIFSKERFLSWAKYPDAEKLPDRVGEMRALLDADESHLYWLFSKDVIPDVAVFAFEGDDPEGSFLAHLVTAEAAKPTQKWLKTTRSHIKRLGASKVAHAFASWLGHCRMPETTDDMPSTRVPIAVQACFSQIPTHAALDPDRAPVQEETIQQLALRAALCPHWWEGDGHSHMTDHALHLTAMAGVSGLNQRLLSGVFWACAELGSEAPLDVIERAGRFCLTKTRGAFQSRKAGNAALWALGQIEQPQAVWMLARLRRWVVRDKAVFKQVDKALTAAGLRMGYTLEDMHEIAEQDWGVGADGCLRARLGDIEVTLRVVSQRRVSLESRPWGDPGAAPKRGIIKAALVDDHAKAMAKELKRAAEDIKRSLPEARRRFENSIRAKRDWAWSDFHERFLENQLVAWLTRRIVFDISWPDGTAVQALCPDGIWQDIAGQKVGRDFADARLRVWHPLMAGPDAMDWADRLAELGMRQPFAQAWRPVYVLTDAERETSTYSNRFAGHILFRPAAVAMFKKRGWVQSDGAFFLSLPAFGLTAAYWATGIGASEQFDEHGFAQRHVTTDRLVFHSDDAPAQPVHLAEVPQLAFSEALRDIEMILGVTSIGRDRFWQDLGEDAFCQDVAGADWTGYAEMYQASGSKEQITLRAHLLARILPGMTEAGSLRLIAPKLEVTGTSGNLYEIHLGSAAVSLGGRHICIVPDSSGDTLDDLLLFEGDPVLSEVLAKAMLLARDKDIKDPVIIRQIFAK